MKFKFTGAEPVEPDWSAQVQNPGIEPTLDMVHKQAGKPPLRRLLP
jgi:hypothetical protein